MDFSLFLGQGHTWLYYAALPLSLGLFFFISWVQRKTNLPWLNPLLVPTVCIIVLIKVTDCDYAEYASGTSFLTFLLEPCVVALSIPLYQKFRMIKVQAVPIVLCCIISILISFLVSYLTCHFMGSSNNMISTIGARSITTPLAMDVSERLGGIVSITACCVCCAGIVGAVIGFPLMKLFHIRNAQAQGLAMGACAHALGTSTANTYGETQGAYSSLSLIVCGVLTTLIATPLFTLLQLLDDFIGW